MATLPISPGSPGTRASTSRIRYVNFTRLTDDCGDELEAALMGVVRSGVYVGGEEVAAFERDFAAYCGTRYAVGVASGQDALELTLRSWGIGSGDEVIVPANTAVPTALAVSHAGAELVLVDVEPDTGSIDAGAAAAAITRATRAIVPVHLYGHAADMDALRELSERAGIRLLEDGAHAHGASYRGRRCGALGAAAAFSFYPTKNLGAFGDGGCVTTDDATLADALRRLRNCGLTANYSHAVKGFNSRLDPLQAAVLRWKLPRLDGWNRRRAELAALYAHALAGVAGLTLPAVRAWATPVWHAFPVLVQNGRRDALRRALDEAGIETNVHYRVPIHLQPAYADGPWRRGQFPISESRAATQLSLPLDPYHTDAEIARVSAAVRAFFEPARGGLVPAGSLQANASW